MITRGMNHRAVFIPLFLAAMITLVVQQPYAYSQVSCKIVNMRFDHPRTVHPDELIHTVSIVTASCFFYSSVILDLVDSRTGAILSRVIWPYDPLANPVSSPLINYAIAPNTIGYWSLSILANFAGSSPGIQFTILVES